MVSQGLSDGKDGVQEVSVLYKSIELPCCSCPVIGDNRRIEHTRTSNKVLLEYWMLNPPDQNDTEALVSCIFYGHIIISILDSLVKKIITVTQKISWKIFYQIK